MASAGTRHLLLFLAASATWWATPALAIRKRTIPQLVCDSWSVHGCSPEGGGSGSGGRAATFSGAAADDSQVLGLAVANENGVDKGSGMTAPYFYYNGVFSIDIKHDTKDSTNICSAFYLIDPTSQSNKDPEHAEIDIEFYGSDNTSAIFMATNVFVGGRQSLAQFSLPFDPAADFHRYTIQWNNDIIAWLVDGVTYRVLERNASEPWPAKYLYVKSTAWMVNWGTEVQDFSDGPITTRVRNPDFQGCRSWSPNRSNSCPKMRGPRFPWNVAPDMSQLTPTSNGYVLKSRCLNDWGWDTA